MSAATFFGTRPYPQFTRVSHSANQWTYREFTDGSAILFTQHHDPIILEEITPTTLETLPTDALQAIHEALAIIADALAQSQQNTRQ